MTVDLVKRLIGSTDCCPDPPCLPERPAVAGEMLPAGLSGTPWTGTVIFSGALSLVLATSEPPEMDDVNGWANLDIPGGGPAVAGAVTMSVSAANASGKVVTRVVVGLFYRRS
jgi:hypothetical protein